jgi:hypothetical protein
MQAQRPPSIDRRPTWPTAAQAWRCPRGLAHPLLVLGCVLSSGALSCSGDTVNGLPPLPPAQAYWALQVNYYAVNLALAAPYDTVHLVATPVNAVGTPVTGLGKIVYTVTDSTVTVDSTTGLLTARYVTESGGTQIIVSLQDTLHRVTHAATVTVQVTPTVPPVPIRSFSLQPVPGDSAKRAFDFQRGQFNWPVTALDANGDTVCNANACALNVFYTSSNPGVATIDPAMGSVTVQDTGLVTFTATAWVYGAPEQASLAFVVGYALNQYINLTVDTVLGKPIVRFNSFPPVLTLGVGAKALFLANYDSAGVFIDGSTITYSNWRYNVVFDDSVEVDSASDSYFGIPIPASGRGNISPFGDDTATGLNSFLANARARSFPIPGVFKAYSTVSTSDTENITIKKENFR